MAQIELAINQSGFNNIQLANNRTAANSQTLSAHKIASLIKSLDPISKLGWTPQHSPVHDGMSHGSCGSIGTRGVGGGWVAGT